MRTWVAWAGVLLVLLPRPRLLSVRLRDLPLFVLYGVVGFALFELLYLFSLERSPVTIAVALLYTAPGFVMLLSWLLWRDRVGGPELAALLVVLVGVLLVTGALRTLVAGRAAVTTLAAGIGLGSGLTYALYTIFSKVALRRYPPLTALFWSFAFASIALLFVEPPLEPLLRSPDALPLLIALGLVPTLFPYLLYLSALRWLRASTAAMLACIEPVAATLLAAWLLHERLDALQAAGMVLIVLAAASLSGAIPSRESSRQ